MYYVYILRNNDTDRYYIGSTNNLDRRLKGHSKGLTRTTRVLKTLSLVHSEKFYNESDARLRERKLKSYKSKKYIKWLIDQND